MPKPDDYSNTIIYKITCRDPEIKDVYVGHTVDFIQRKHTHKQSCNNEKNNCKLYNTIRAKGGWNNWKMEIVNFFDCVDHYEARQKEQEYFISLNATLNSVEPMPKPKEELHMLSLKPNTFICQLCNYKCCKNSEWIRHTSTTKHKTNQNESPEINDSDKITSYVCNCSRNYMSLSGLWKHKKKCTFIDVPEQKKEYVKTIDANLILQLLKQNQDLQTQMIELCKNSSISGNNIDKSL